MQKGALLDLVGTRAEDLPRSFVLATNRAYPRAGMTAEITSLIGAEAGPPEGPLRPLARCGFTALVPVAPHRPR